MKHLKIYEADFNEEEKLFREKLLDSFDPEVKYELVVVFEDGKIIYSWIDKPNNNHRILERLIRLSNGESKIKYSYIRTIKKVFTLSDDLYPEYEYKINAKKYNL